VTIDRFVCFAGAVFLVWKGLSVKEFRRDPFQLEVPRWLGRLSFLLFAGLLLFIGFRYS
jgi:hypothetical protein